ncbi:MAG: (2Fe-2S)-binding protein [Betaproteobacteria bacterium]|nr:(2Fe-2S)-binding protein [Betaproteobacteria bacterium]
MTQALTFTVNGKTERIETDDPKMPLLYALRNQLGFKSMHFGCGLAQCGACTVHVSGKPVRSCSFPVASAAGEEILTLDGIGNAAKPHPLQLAFIEEQAAQCGYCANGMIMQAKALLDSNRSPSDRDIKRALANNLCRCGTHQRIVRAVKRAAKMMA